RLGAIEDEGNQAIAERFGNGGDEAIDRRPILLGQGLQRQHGPSLSRVRDAVKCDGFVRTLCRRLRGDPTEGSMDARTRRGARGNRPPSTIADGTESAVDGFRLPREEPTESPRKKQGATLLPVGASAGGADRSADNSLIDGQRLAGTPL